MLKRIAVYATVSVACLTLANIFDGSDALITALYISTGISTALLLAKGFSLISLTQNEAGLHDKRSILAHILLHIVPASYAVLQYSMGTSLLINRIYLIPFLMFFYTGSLTWKEMYRQFGKQMYRIYLYGNTSVMLGLPLLLALGWLVDPSFGTDAYRKAAMGYISVHFLVTGWTLIGLEKDLMSRYGHHQVR